MTKTFGRGGSCPYTLAAMPARGGASRGAPATRTGRREPQSVRAFRRAMRRATDWRRTCVSPNATLARLSPRLGTRALAASEQLDGGGPSPLTEDRQKPLQLMHGTRNTVHSIAFGAAKPYMPLRSGAGFQLMSR